MTACRPLSRSRRISDAGNLSCAFRSRPLSDAAVTIQLDRTKRVLAAFLGVAMVLNYMWAKGQVLWVPTSHDTLFILVLLTLGAVGAGRVLGNRLFSS